jgi:hypothetical protein
MKLRELIEKLKQFSPDAIVCVEAWMNPEVKEAKEYMIDGHPYVYIGDDLENLDYELGLCDEEEN